MSGILNPGTYTLSNVAVTTAVTAAILTGVDGLEGITAATIRCQFAYGSSGTSAKA